MLRRLIPLICFLAFAFAASVPTQAWAHVGHAHSEVAMVTDAAPVLDAQSEANAASQSLQSHSRPADQPVNDCHCPACHGCCHAPALSDAAAQFAPFALRSHAAPRDDGWSVRRALSTIDNPPKTFA
jgi:hypothetical protein